MMLNDEPGDREPQTRALGFSFLLVGYLVKLVKDVGSLIRRNSRAIVDHRNAKRVPIGCQTRFDLAGPTLTELRGIGQQIDNNLHHAVAVGIDDSAF